MSPLNKVLQHLESLERGTPFDINELYELASKSSIQKAIRKLALAGKVIRVSRGMNAAPKPPPSLPSIIITTSPEEIAKLWAKTHEYRLASQGAKLPTTVAFKHKHQSELFTGVTHLQGSLHLGTPRYLFATF